MRGQEQNRILFKNAVRKVFFSARMCCSAHDVPGRVNDEGSKKQACPQQNPFVSPIFFFAVH